MKNSVTLEDIESKKKAMDEAAMPKGNYFSYYDAKTDTVKTVCCGSVTPTLGSLFPSLKKPL